MRRLITLSAAALLVVAVPSAALPFAPGEVTPSGVCGGCHRDIYRMWRASAHANAMENVVFLQAYRKTASREGTAAARLCLGCHAPLFEVNEDPDLKLRVTWEGVSCDACHSLVSVTPTATGAPRQIFEPGPVKRGPIRDAASTAHEVAYSELHTRALVCIGCHEFTNAEGTPIITTYSEWEQSRAGREGRACQGCHMALTRADVVDPKVARVEQSHVNLHQMPGGHSLQQLHQALRVTMRLDRGDDALTLEVRIANAGAGHAVPTGMPGRRIILAADVHTADGNSFRERRVYTKSFIAADGSPVTEVPGFFASGIRLEKDSRIKPDEERIERFSFPIGPRAGASLSLRLHYEHSPTGEVEDRTWLTFYSERRVLSPSVSATH
jgi:hypothetical protein